MRHFSVHVAYEISFPDAQEKLPSIQAWEKFKGSNPYKGNSCATHLFLVYVRLCWSFAASRREYQKNNFLSVQTSPNKELSGRYFCQGCNRRRVHLTALNHLNHVGLCNKEVEERFRPEALQFWTKKDRHTKWSESACLLLIPRNFNKNPAIFIVSVRSSVIAQQSTTEIFSFCKSEFNSFSEFLRTAQKIKKMLSDSQM